MCWLTSAFSWYIDTPTEKTPQESIASPLRLLLRNTRYVLFSCTGLAPRGASTEGGKERATEAGNINVV